MDIVRRKLLLVTIGTYRVNTDNEGAIESVCIKLVEFREDVRAWDKDNCP